MGNDSSPLFDELSLESAARRALTADLERLGRLEYDEGSSLEELAAREAGTDDRRESFAKAYAWMQLGRMVAAADGRLASDVEAASRAGVPDAYLEGLGSLRMSLG